MTSSITFLAHFNDLSEAQCQAIVRLRGMVFSKDKTFEELLNAFQAHKMAPAAERRFFLTVENHTAWQTNGETLLANAELFPRDLIIVEDKTLLPIWALASVCTLPSRQGEGLGRQTVLKALAFARENGACCAFQTDVPEFYARLGCAKVENEFCNSAPVEEEKRRMWWCNSVMIHPASADWPKGKIDLNGPAF
ncbi:MAG: GNAT family N-acetyltransferase [Sumerlaeia bacterium]